MRSILDETSDVREWQPGEWGGGGSSEGGPKETANFSNTHKYLTCFDTAENI